MRSLVYTLPALGAPVVIFSMMMQRRRGGGSLVGAMTLLLLLGGPGFVVPLALNLMDGMTGFLTGTNGDLANRYSAMLDRGFSGKSKSDSDPSSTASPSPTSTATPSPHTSTPSASATPSPSNTSHDAGPDASHTWASIWPWLLGVLVLLVVIAFGVWLIAHAAEKRRDIREAAEARRADAKRRAEIRAAVDADWKNMRLRDDALVERWNGYARDLNTLLTMPAIRNVSVPTTAAAIEALLDLDTERTPYAPSDCTNAKSTAYASALRKAEAAVKAAADYARGDALRSMPKHERDMLTDAQRLLALAENAAATPAERQRAYERVRTIMDKLSIEVPEKILESIEHETRKLIEAGSRA